MDIENYCQDYCLETIFPKHYFKDLQVITLTAGQSVCKQGEQLEYLHYIVKGRFKIVRRLFNGKEHILAIEEQGYFQLELSSLADSFGVSYRHLLRVIHDMVKEGLIQKEKPKYFIKNRFALESLNIQP